MTDWKIRHADIVQGGELVVEMTDLAGVCRKGRTVFAEVRDDISAVRMVNCNVGEGHGTE